MQGSNTQSDTTMLENAQTESVVPENFDNLLLKRWLRSVGPVRRFVILRKLKADLQNLGLSRRRVHRGLVQLMTNPHVVLSRQLPNRSYGSQNRLEKDDKYKTADNREKDEDEQRPDSTESFAEEDSQRNEKGDRLETFKTVSVNDNREALALVNHHELKISSEMKHSFDEALEQSDKLISSKMKSSSRRTSVVSADTTSKSQNNNVALSKNHSEVENKNTRETQGWTPDRIDTMAVQTTPDRDKKSRLKSNLSSSYSKKASDTDGKLQSNEKTISTKVHSSSSKSKCSKHESSKNVLAGKEETKTEEKTLYKRKSREVIPSDPAQRRKICTFVEEQKEHNAKRRHRMKRKFRAYFGDCISVSEDEQEEYILRKRFKIRSKKDSVDSCDSGVCVAEGNTTTAIAETPKDVLQVIPDSTILEEDIEEVSESNVPYVDRVLEENIDKKNKEDVQEEKGEDIEDKDKKDKDIENNDKKDKDIENNDKKDKDIEDNDKKDEDIEDNDKKDEEIGSKDVISEENIRVVDNVEGTTNTVKVESACSQNDKFADNIQVELEMIEGNVISNCDTLHIADTSKTIEQADVIFSTAETEAKILTNDATLPSDIPEIFISDYDTSIDYQANESLLEFQDEDLDTKNLNDLLRMNIPETCQISSSGNVLSIEDAIVDDVSESVIDKSFDENSNLKELPKMEADTNQNIKEEILVNSIEENNDTHLSVKEDTEVIDLDNSMDNAVNDDNKSVSQESELHDDVSKNEAAQFSKPQVRLRILTSAELGSRWCPTPINTGPSTTAPQFTRANTIAMSEVPLDRTIPVTTLTEAVPATISATARSASTTIADTMSEHVNKSNIITNLSECVYVTFVKIRNLIQSIRLGSNINFNYDILLYREFEKLRKALKTENYIAVMEGALCILNRELSVAPKLSLVELFRYSPLLRDRYMRTSLKVRSELNESQTTIPTTVSGRLSTLNQNTLCNPQMSQNMYPATSFQTQLRHLLSVAAKQNPIPTNNTPKQPQQRFQENTVVQSQSNMPMNSIAANAQDMQQQNYRLQMQRAFVRQKTTASPYFVKTNQAANVNATQGFRLQQPPLRPNGINQQIRNQISVPVTNASLMTQQFVPQNVVVPQVNTFFNVNIPVQQNRNMANLAVQSIVVPPVPQKHQNVIHGQPIYNMSQGFQLQTALQQVPPNYIPQPVQAIFTINAPQCRLTNVQQTEQTQQTVPQVQMNVPQNCVPEQASSSQNKSKTKPAIVKQPKKKRNLQVSLESTTKQFDILKYLTDIQKLMLLKQLDFYFGCVAWLGQPVASDIWQEVIAQRNRLLQFQTLLKHLIEKTVKNLSPNESQKNTFETNILATIKIGIPKVVKIIMKENRKACYQDKTPKPAQEQGTTATTDNNQENVKVITQKDCEVVDTLKNKTVSKTTNKSEIFDKEQVQKKEACTNNTVVIQKSSDSLVKSNLDTQTLDSDVNEKDEAKEELQIPKDMPSLDSSDENIERLEKMIENLSPIAEEKASVSTSTVPGTKKNEKDTSHQSTAHLVTVEISSNNDQVTVIDTNSDSGNKSINEEPENHVELLEEQLHTTDSAITLESSSEVILVHSPKKPSSIECFIKEDMDSFSSEEAINMSYIEDVRSISLEAFEKIGENTNVNTIMENHVEEEEIKICLYCGKPSTVACSICLEAKYCSKICSEQHWEIHYKDCIPVERRVCME